MARSDSAPPNPFPESLAPRKPTFVVKYLGRPFAVKGNAPVPVELKHPVMTLEANDEYTARTLYCKANGIADGDSATAAGSPPVWDVRRA
jgi:hypothetical protein